MVVKRTFDAVLLLFLLSVVLIFVVVAVGARDIYVDGSYPYSTGDGSVDHPYQTIQHAIDVAEDGDTIYVFSGTYNESLTIDKKLTLQGLDKGNTTIWRNAKHRYTIEISADFVTLEDFNIKAGSGCRVAAVYVTSDVVTIQGNTINVTGDTWGVYLDSSDGDTIGSNTVVGGKGVYVYSSVNDAFTNNEISNATDAALKFQTSDNAIVYGNLLLNNRFGVYAQSCSSFNITNNTIQDNHLDGVDLYLGSNNIVFRNTVAGNANGLDMKSDDGVVWNNTFDDNGIGLILAGLGCKVYGNIFEDSTSYGVYADSGSSGNLVYENRFLKNTVHALEKGSNQWDNGVVGNYWDNYDDVDRNLDGIGDYPYHISGGGIDHYPTGNFLKPPDKPTDPSPKDGASNVGLTPTLQVKVSDPDSDSLTVYFYRADDDSLIAERHGVPSGGTASCSFHMAYNTVMAWYVVVNDSKLEATSDIWVFTTVPIPPTNNKPVADPGGPYSGEVNEAIQFDGTKSHDPDGSIAFYRWNFGDGSGEILADKPTHTYSEAGTYTVTLTVIDNDGTSDTAVTSAVIGEASTNKAPVADAGGPYEAKVGEQVLFDASYSYDPDGSIVSYVWDFGDGETGEGQTVQHVYSKPDTYIVKLTVTDDAGGTDSSSTYVVVSEEKKTPGFEFFSVVLAVMICFVVLRKRG
ncbi:MAG: right-handed parallel beta-helix repeat-containing protein [Thermoplasmata archaeon]|nr:right-handed parallel beta-helix repeat-containing protein [Thermoplasmata archaeon]